MPSALLITHIFIAKPDTFPSSGLSTPLPSQHLTGISPSQADTRLPFPTIPPPRPALLLPNHKEWPSCKCSSGKGPVGSPLPYSSDVSRSCHLSSNPQRLHHQHLSPSCPRDAGLLFASCFLPTNSSLPSKDTSQLISLRCSKLCHGF